MGLKQDLHLVGADYSWLGSVFYFGSKLDALLNEHDRLTTTKVISAGNTPLISSYNAFL